MNGDGRMDLLEKDGWWEQPASLEGDPIWTFHKVRMGSGGSQMYAYDVNGDGLDDLIIGLLDTKTLFQGGAYVLYRKNESTVPSSRYLVEMQPSEGLFVRGQAWSYAGYSVSGAGESFTCF